MVCIFQAMKRTLKRFSFRGTILAVSLVIVTSCSPSHSKMELIPATAEKILETVHQQQGNKAVLLNFWATWCEPCVEEFPFMVKLSRDYAGRGLQVYFVSVDWLEEREAVVAFLKRQGVRGPAFLKDQDDNTFINTISTDWSGAVPFTIVYHRRDGSLVDQWEGEKPEQYFRSAVEKSLTTKE